MTIYLAFGSFADQVIALVCGLSVPVAYAVSRRNASAGVLFHLVAILLWTSWHLRQPDSFELRLGLYPEQVFSPLASVITFVFACFWGWRGGLLGIILSLLTAPAYTSPALGVLAVSTLLMSAVGEMIHGLIRQLEITRASLSDMSRRDPLTGLGNRRAFAEDILSFKRQTLNSGQPLYLVLWDLDGLKAINDRDGHAAGDRFILEFVQALKRCTSPLHGLYRVGGDEFCTLHIGSGVEDLVTLVVQQFSQVSAGIALVGNDRPEHALEQADRQMYEQKRKRKVEKRETLTA